MKIEMHAKVRMTITQFAEENDLILEIHERDKNDFYVHFKRSDIIEGIFLVGEYGDGQTIYEAISNYAKIISGKTIVIDALRRTRREIYVPQLIVKRGEINELYLRS